MQHRGHARWLAWPTLGYLLVFFLVPMGIVASYSVLERDFAGGVSTEFSAEAWRQATSERTLTILYRSLRMALAVTAACLLLGYPCALALAQLDARWRQLALVLLTFPLITSLLLRIYGWMNLLPLEWRGTLTSVAFVLTTSYLPFLLLPLLRSWERIPANLTQAAMDLGATPWQTFWRVIWPLTRSGRWAGCALVFIPASGEYLVPHFIGEGKVLVLGTLIVESYGQRNAPYVAALAVWLLALVTVPIVLSVLGRSEPARPREVADA